MDLIGRSEQWGRKQPRRYTVEKAVDVIVQIAGDVVEGKWRRDYPVDDDELVSDYEGVGALCECHPDR